LNRHVGVIYVSLLLHTCISSCTGHFYAINTLKIITGVFGKFLFLAEFCF
jgi:hypothetical protein